MKGCWKVWLLLVMLLSLAGCVPLGASDCREDAQAAALVELAKEDLRRRLSVQTEAIAVQSVEPWVFPCFDADTFEACRTDPGTSRPGYLIVLAADSLVYEYNGKVVGDFYLIWREV